MTSSSWFATFAKNTSRAVGRPAAFGLAFLIVATWAVTGPIFDFSDTWQLMINTGTTIVTFLMVFLIQHTQNRDAEAVQVKLDELIRATEGAHNALLDLEDTDDERLEKLRLAYTALAVKARKTGSGSRATPDVAIVLEENSASRVRPAGAKRKKSRK